MRITPIATIFPRNGDKPPARLVSSAPSSVCPLIRYSRTYGSCSSHGMPTVSISMTSFFMDGLGTILGRDFELVDEFLDRTRRLVERSPLLAGQFDLDDLFDSIATELHRHADIQSADTVFTLKKRSARQNLPFVLQDCFDHLNGRGRRRIPR